MFFHQPAAPLVLIVCRFERSLGHLPRRTVEPPVLTPYLFKRLLFIVQVHPFLIVEVGVVFDIC